MSKKRLKNKVLIIGGSGFVGSNLISEIGKQGCLNLDKKPSPFFNEITEIGDIQKKDEILIDPNCRTVVLLAAEHRDDISPDSIYYDVNVKGTKNVLEKMDEARVKNLIFTSSVAIYGLNKNNPNEEDNEDPFNHYGKSKWQAEQLIKKWYNTNPIGKSVTIIRPTVIFGEHNRGNVYNLLKQISSGRFLMIGSGQNKKSMAYVGNVAAFITHRLEKQELGYHIFNYADKPDYNMLELVSIIEKKSNVLVPKIRIPYWLGMLGGYSFDIISKLSGKKLSVSSMRVKKFCARTQFDAEKAHEFFSEPFTLEQGLNKTLDHEFINPKNDNISFYTE